MVTGMGAWPSYLRNGPISVAIGEESTVTEPSESSADPEDGLHLLKAALEEQLDGCRVHRILGVGGVSACFAANIQPYGDVAVKVTSRGSEGGSSWLAEAAEVRCAWHPHLQKSLLPAVSLYHVVKQAQSNAHPPPQSSTGPVLHQI